MGIQYSRHLLPVLTGAVLVGTALSNCTAYTRPYQESQWARDGITSLQTIRAGGIDHAVLIRGTDRSRPLLIFVHGFAVPMMPFEHMSYPDRDDLMEQRFVVVHYDQRGAGKTARIAGPDTGPFTVDQYVRDAEELTASLMKQFGRKKVYLVGVSWGSIIGMKLVQKHPDWFYAYIAEGQAVHLPDTYRDVRKFITEAARVEKNEEALREIAAVPDPAASLPRDQAVHSTEVLARWLDHYSQKKYHLLDLQPLFLKAIREAPEYTFLDFIATVRSIESFTRHNTLSMLSTNLRAEVPQVDAPVYFITGEYDLMKIAGKDYFDRLKAPKKRWIEVQKAGHAVSADQPGIVQSIYIDQVLRETYGP